MVDIRGLYAVTIDSDPQVEQNVYGALNGGCKIVQYRNKTRDDYETFAVATRLKALCVQFGATLIINDNIELAKAVDADGVHVGKDDASIEDVKAALPGKIVGASCYGDVTLAIEAEKRGADYVAFGRFFNSVTKPNATKADVQVLESAKGKLSVPIVAIGGINMNNAESLIDAGASAIAVVNGLFNEQDIENCARTFISLFDPEQEMVS